MLRRSLIASVLLANLALLACAHAEPRSETPALQVTDAWSRPTVAVVKVGVAYMRIRNAGADDDVLLSVSSPRAASVEIHQTTMNDGVMQMRPLDDVPIPAGKTVVLEPGATHLMLMGLKSPLQIGERVPLQLVFLRAGPVDVESEVRQP